MREQNNGRRASMKITCNKRVYGDSMLPGPGDYDPLQYRDADETLENVEFIYVELDADIIIDEEGSWNYLDEDYPWACPDDSSSDWYSEEYPDVYLDDCSGVVEKVDELIADKLPSQPGHYHISGQAKIYYNITDVEVYRDYQGRDEDNDLMYDETINSDDAYVEHVPSKDTLENFECVDSSIHASTNICAGVTFGNPKSSSSPRYGMYTDAQYKGVNFSIHYNEIDTSPEADPVEMLN